MENFNNDQLFAWLREEMKEIKDEGRFFRNETLPRLYRQIEKNTEFFNRRIDELIKEIACIKGKVNSLPHIKYFYTIILALLSLIAGTLGIKILPDLLK